MTLDKPVVPYVSTHKTDEANTFLVFTQDGREIYVEVEDYDETTEVFESHSSVYVPASGEA